MGDVRDVLVLLSAGTTGAAIVALLFGALLLIDQEADNNDLTKSVLPLFVGDMIGVAVVTPLLLRLSRLWQQRADWIAWLRHPPFVIPAEVTLFALVTGFALWMIVGSARPNDYKYFSLLFLPVVAVGRAAWHRRRLPGPGRHQLGLVALLRAYGYDAAGFTEFQIVMLVLTMTGLLVGVRGQRARACRSAARAGRGAPARGGAGGGAGRALQHGERHGVGAGARDQPADDGGARAGPLGAAADEAQPAADTERANEQPRDPGGADRSRRRRRAAHARVPAPRPAACQHPRRRLHAGGRARPRPAGGGGQRHPHRAAGRRSLPAVFGDRIQLQQVVLNLVRNAIDAIVEAGVPQGRVARARLPRRQAPERWRSASPTTAPA